jgi:Holliday junction resolvase RusA-like endonuclease
MLSERCLRRIFPNASEAFIRDNAEANGFPSRERDQQERTDALEPATQGTAASVPRVTVSFTCYRCRLLDTDNNSRSCKDLLDGLRHAHLIQDDSPERIFLVTSQVKVAHKREERTEIEITYP